MNTKANPSSTNDASTLNQGAADTLRAAEDVLHKAESRIDPPLGARAAERMATFTETKTFRTSSAIVKGVAAIGGIGAFVTGIILGKRAFDNRRAGRNAQQ
jgi:hypothetical protein